MQTKDACREPRHLVDSRLEVKQTEIAGVVTQHPRKRAPEARVRVFVVGQAVGANHGTGMAQDPLQVVFVHLEVDGTGRLQAVDRFTEGAVPARADVFEVLALELRMRM